MATFEALFPPAFEADQAAGDAADNVDISVEDIALPPLERAVEASVLAALRRWNELEPAAAEKALPYLERVSKYQRLVAAILYRSEGDDLAASALTEDDEEAEESAEESAERKKQRKRATSTRESKKRQRRHRKLMGDFQRIFGALPDIEELRAERAPSARMQQFLDLYKPKKTRLAQKRSAADTTTARSFEFARRPPPPTVEGNKTEEDKPVLPVGDQRDPVMWIDVLHPTKDPAKTQAFLVRGSQSLSDVIDLVACAYDERLREHGRISKMVFFGGHFYVDERDSSAVDYSEQIRAWLKAKPGRLTKYGCENAADEQPRSLHRTRFRDLKLLIDVPGVYIHQGECEHLLRLRDVRVAHEWDDLPTATSGQGVSVFPMRLPNTLYRSLRNCFICQHYSAKFVSYGDRMSLSSPMFFCNRCYRAAHYDRNGKLLYNDFQSFPYVQE